MLVERVLWLSFIDEILNVIRFFSCDGCTVAPLSVSTSSILALHLDCLGKLHAESLDEQKLGGKAHSFKPDVDTRCVQNVDEPDCLENYVNENKAKDETNLFPSFLDFGKNFLSGWGLITREFQYQINEGIIQFSVNYDVPHTNEYLSREEPYILNNYDLCWIGLI